MFKNLKERALDMYQKVKQTAEQAEVTINKFVSDNRHSDNQEIVIILANELVNLINKQTVEQAEVTIKKLAELAADNRYSDNQKIVLCYAKGLTNSKGK